MSQACIKKCCGTIIPDRNTKLEYMILHSCLDDIQISAASLVSWDRLATVHRVTVHKAEIRPDLRNIRWCSQSLYLSWSLDSLSRTWRPGCTDITFAKNCMSLNCHDGWPHLEDSHVKHSLTEIGFSNLHVHAVSYHREGQQWHALS